jgi:hypothetical protein
MSIEAICVEVVSTETSDELGCDTCLHEKLPSSDVRCAICSQEISCGGRGIISCWQPKEGGAK